jgi:peptide/nickel transport system substrate-binding protein
MKKGVIPLTALWIFTFILIGSNSLFSAPTTPKYGGIIKIYILEPYSLGYPATMTGQTDGQSSSVCLETLFRFDANGNLVPLLATDWKADPSAKTLTLTLRKGVKFHDGTDFNAAVCKWNLEEFKAGKRPDLKRVQSIDVVDDHTVRLNLSVFDNTIVSSLANGSDAGRMISQAAFAAHGKAWCEQNPVGTGPFQFVSREKDVGIRWKRFDGYWGGKPYLDGIEMVRIADPMVAVMAFKSGALDLFNPDPRDGRALVAEGKFNYAVTVEGQVPAIAGYAKDPNSPFADLRVRQAIAYAIDVKTICESFGLGYWTVQNQWAVPGSWGYNPNVVGYPYNPAKAKELLTAAGYPNGFKTTLSFYSTTQMLTDECTAIQRYLKDINIDCSLNPLQRPAFADMASLGKGWNGLVRMQGFSSPDPLLKYAGVASGQEFAGVYLPQEFQDVYARAVSAPDFASKQKLVHQLMKLATDKYCIAAHLYVQGQVLVKSKRVQDDLYGNLPYRYLSPKTWVSD